METVKMLPAGFLTIKSVHYSLWLGIFFTNTACNKFSRSPYTHTAKSSFFSETYRKIEYFL